MRGWTHLIHHAIGPFATSAFHLLTVINFICLVAGTYLLLILYDREREVGYLLTAIAFTVIALQIISAQLTLSDPVLHYASETLALVIIGLLLVCGTLFLVAGTERNGETGAVGRTLLTGAAAVALGGVLVVWALPFSEALREAVTRAGSEDGLVTFQNGLRVAVAAAMVACTWITWDSRLLGNELSRMFGAAYFLWGSSIMIGVMPLWSPESGFWISHVVWVLGSIFIGNALVVHVYRAERNALDRQRRLRLMDRVTSAAVASPDLQSMIETVSRELRDLLETSFVAVYLIDRSECGELWLAHRRGDEEVELPEQMAVGSDEGIGSAVKHRRPVEVRLSYNGEGGMDAVAVPLIGLEDCVGVLVMALPSNREFTEASATTLESAGTQLGVILQHMVLMEQTREARDRWRQTFDSITEIVTVHDVDGRIKLANSAAMAFTGLTEREIVGRRISDLPGDSEGQDETLAACVETGASPGASIHRTRGRVHQVRVTPVRDDSEGVVGCVRVARDVTSRRRAEERLAHSERRYRELAENANDIIYVHDIDGSFLYVNSAAVRILGYSREEFRKTRFWDLVAPESMEEARRYLEDLIAGGSDGRQIELRMIGADDDVVVLQLRANVVRRNGSEKKVIQGIARDVTAETALTAQLIQADRLASAGKLIAGIAHELNNPLTTIGGYAELLSERLADTPSADGIDIIAQEADRCRAIAQGLLNFAHQTDNDSASFDLNALIQGVFDLRAYDLRAADIALKADLADGLSEVVGDYNQIQQVIYNLIENAFDALQENGGGEITVTTGEDGEQVYVRVEDTGPGIPSSMLKRIFEPFATTKERGEGVGLGLSICRQILDLHGGTIRAENSAGAGAVFTVTLPVADASSMPGPTERDADEEPEEISTERDGVRVLLIDDEAPLRVLMSEYLQRAGYAVTVAATGEEGLEFALAEDFDAIVCDMRLPGINGDEVCRRLLEERPDQVQRTVIATGDVLSVEVQHFLDRTGLAHIHKPFKLADLEKTLDDLVSHEAISDH